MTPAAIELFIDRICGYFPTTNIARNTVKSAWRQEDELINVSDEDAKKALKLIQNESAFPNLARVKQIIRSLNKTEGSEYCGLCDNGWVYMHPLFEEMGKPNYVGRCTCQGGMYEPKVEVPQVQEFDYDLR